VTAELRPFVIDYLSLENNYIALADIERDIAASVERLSDPSMVRLGGAARHCFLSHSKRAVI
jgi:hypothetical protein